MPHSIKSTNVRKNIFSPILIQCFRGADVARGL